MLRNFAWTIVGFVVLALVFFAGAQVGENHNCYAYADQSASLFCYAKAAILDGWVNVSDNAEKYESAIVGLGTLAIAWFTWTLRQSTEKLWRSGEQQIQVANITAAAAAANAAAAVASSRAHIWMAEIRCTFERAADGHITGNKINYVVANSGPTPGFIEMISTGAYFGPKANWPTVPVYNNVALDHFGMVRPQGTHLSEAQAPNVISDEELADIASGKQILVVFGYIIYSDAIDSTVQHKSGFAYRLRFKPKADVSDRCTYHGPTAYWHYK